MDIFEILKNENLTFILGGLGGILGGIISGWFSHRVLNKRGVFSYYVNHSRVGVSAMDSVFGNVSVTWNNQPMQHLFFSNLELKNESLNDYENVVIQTYTDDTTLLSESTQVIGSPDILTWTEKFNNLMRVESDQNPTEYQIKKFNSSREYLIPVFNRGQVIRITYLNSAATNNLPSIWLSAAVKGVKVKFQIPTEQIFGVPQPLAAFSGVVIGLLVVIPIVLFVSNPWLIAFLAITFGFIAQLPGALCIKLIRKIREVVGG